VITFDYRAPEDYAPNLLVHSDGRWFQLRIGSDGQAYSRYYTTVTLPQLQFDGAWHHAQIDVLGALRAADPDKTTFQIDEIALGQVKSGPYMQVTLLDGGAAGSAYELDNFAILRPTNAAQVALTWTASGDAYNAALDQDVATAPATTAQYTQPSATLSFPAQAADGLWYAHVRARGASGWSAAAHYPVLLDRTPPVTGEPNPRPDGVGTADFLFVPVADASSGLDLSALQVEINGQRYAGAGKGVSYHPELGGLGLTPYVFNPPLPPAPNGQSIMVSVQLADYAGNALAAPLVWTFTAQRPHVAGEPFRMLTRDGGELPALAPDGTQIAFVANRQGVDQVWLMPTSDYGEQSNSVRALTAAGVWSSDPAWSPDGKLLAYVSNDGGSRQVWSAAPDGTGARALTALNGVPASPTWSPDGAQIAFVLDGNLWAMNADGSGLRALTNEPDQPIRAVRWQPGGNLLAVDYKLYQETIEIFDPATGALTPLTDGGQERAPAWLNADTVLYTAPAGPNLPDAVWRINLDGSGSAIIDGSGQPGVGDMEPSAAAGGSAVALSSTRGGSRNIWLQATLQIARFEALPANGAPAGVAQDIVYTLPADGQVTLEVQDNGGQTLRILLDQASQGKGEQHVAWDGTGIDNLPLAPGDYRLHLSVAIGGGEPLDRLASARVLDPANVGSLALRVEQWNGEPALRDDLHVAVYPAGQRAQTAAHEDYNVEPQFKLASGRYDVVVRLGEVRREFNGLAVTGQQTTTQVLNLGLGGLAVSVLLSPGEPIQGYVPVHVTPSGRSSGGVWGFYNDTRFALLPGRYDVTAEYEGVRRAVYGVVVRAGQTTTQEINLGSGQLEINVLSYAGRPAVGGLLIASAYRPEDHETRIGTSLFQNPARMRLPGGAYDILLDYTVGPHAGGEVKVWINGVTITPGETTTLEQNLHLGAVDLSVFEAPGKPGDAGRLVFFVYPRGTRDERTVTALFINSVTAEIPPGAYDVIADYGGTELRNVMTPVPIEVREGLTTTQSIDLALARAQILVVDDSGQPIAAERVDAHAYTAGQRDKSFAFSLFRNPMELVLLGGVAYDFVIELDGGAKKLTLERQTVVVGDTLVVTVKESDFK
jgi:hypothetical protein